MLGETAMTRLEIARNLGIEFETQVVGDKETTVVPMLSVEDGINAVRMRFNSLWIDEKKCAPLLDALIHYRKKWNDAMGRFEEKPLHDWSSHLNDALRYWAITPLDFITGDSDMFFEYQVSQNRMRDRSFK